MKLSASLLVFAFLFSISSCKKNDSDPAQQTTGACTENPYKIGTTASYSTSSSPYSVTCPSTLTYNSKAYTKLQSSASSSASYIHVDASGSVWYYVPAITGADIGATEMIVVKTGKSVGETWTYSYNSVNFPGLITYKYTYKVLANNISFTLAGKTYSNCSKVESLLETFMSSTLTGPGQKTATTWGCGVGVIASEVNGTPYSTLTSYTY